MADWTKDPHRPRLLAEQRVIIPFNQKPPRHARARLVEGLALLTLWGLAVYGAISLVLRVAS